MRVRVFVTLKPSVFDPQGRTIADALHSLGYAGVEDVRQGKYFELDLATTFEFDPTVLDLYDMDEGKRTKARLLGIPQGLIRDRQAVAKVRRIKQEAQEKLQQQQLALQGQVEMQSAMGKRVAQGA